MKHRTETVYDDEMNPLVAKLIEIAKREGIPLFISAGMIDANGGPMTCDTCIQESLADTPPVLRGIRNRQGLALNLMRGHAGLDRAAGLVISRYHPETDEASDA